MSVRVVRVRRFWAYAREYASYACPLFGRIAIRHNARARNVLYRGTCTTHIGRVGAHTGVTAAAPAPPSSHSSAYGSTPAPGSSSICESRHSVAWTLESR